MGTPNLPETTHAAKGDKPLPPAPPGAPRPRVTVRAILFYQRCDQVSGVLISFALVFAPWAFGTTQPWSVRVMNLTGYLLGLLLVGKLFVRWRLGYNPARWLHAPARTRPEPRELKHRVSRVLTVGLAILTCAIVGYCLLAALNARAVYNPTRMDFTYQSHLSWLPHSYDAPRTWQSFGNYLALAWLFWAVRDWLLGKTPDEIRADRPEALVVTPRSLLPSRLKRLLWLLSFSSALLAVESIAQRLSGTQKLLWVMETRINKDAAAQFGPYAYRGEAASYFNLVWPVTLGFWWTLRRELRHGLQTWERWPAFRTHGLLLCVLLMAACPILSLSRGGAFVTLANMVVAAAILLFGLRHRHPLVKQGVLLFFGATLAFGFYLSWDKLSERLKETGGGLATREAINQTARKIAGDYPLFGTGPGSFEPVFQLYRESPDEYWPAQLHNDWLETRVTFGWVGSSLIALAFILAMSRWFFPGNIQGGWRFTSFLWVALAGCLLHARFDFPLQVYSILFLFLVLCSILFSLSRPSP